MKTANGKVQRPVLSVIACVAGLVVATPAQNYSIDWSTVDRGGGMSTGGVYCVSGTIGQADAGIASGGN